MALVTRGGESGPVLVAGKPDESALLARIADKSMPPEGELPLTAEQVEVIRRWIESGAAASDHAVADDEDGVSETAPPIANTGPSSGRCA